MQQSLVQNTAQKGRGCGAKKEEKDPHICNRIVSIYATICYQKYFNTIDIQLSYITSIVQYTALECTAHTCTKLQG